MCILFEKRDHEKHKDNPSLKNIIVHFPTNQTRIYDVVKDVSFLLFSYLFCNCTKTVSKD